MRDGIDWLTLGADVRRRRSAKGLGLRDAAKLLGTSAATLSRAERGKKTDAELFLSLCGWLDKSPFTYIAAKRGREIVA